MLYDDAPERAAGLQIYRDFSNPNLRYYLPHETPRIARINPDGSGDLALRLVLYRPDPNAPPPEGFENGGGFLNLDVDLGVTEQQLERARQELGGSVQLVPVPFVDGSVELVLLGVGREDEGQPFVRKIAGSAVPSLYGNQRASFSVVLDRDGAALMRQVIEGGGLTMALAIYHLKYAAIGPAYNLKITVDYQRVSEHLDLRLRAGLESRSFVGRAGFHLLMEELQESRAITVEEVDPIPGEDGRSVSSQETIHEIIGNLMGSRWFRPTLASQSQLAQLGEAAGSGRSGGSTRAPASARTPSDPGSSRARTPSSEQPTPSEPREPPTERLGEVQWETLSTDPPSTPLGTGWPRPTVASEEGATEVTLTIPGSPQRVTVDDQAVPLEGDHVRLDVPSGSSRHVRITWPDDDDSSSEPQPEPITETFHVFFAFDQPDGDAATMAYTEVRAPATQDVRFMQHSRSPQGEDRGIDAFRDWLSRLTNDEVDLVGHASFEPRGPGEGFDEQAHEARERALVQRRLDAVGRMIDRLFPSRFSIGERNRSDDDAEAGTVAVLPDDPGREPDGHGDTSLPAHRVVIVTGRRTPEADAGPDRVRTLEGRVLRSAAPEGDGDRDGNGGRGDDPDADGDRDEGGLQLTASFEVDFEMIQREEKITATYELSSRKARYHEIHPQGQLALDVPDPSRYVLEADGAIEFFQKLVIRGTTTAAWQLDGIDSIVVQLRYGPRDDGTFVRTGDLVLTPEQDEDTFEAFVLREDEDPARRPVYWYEYRVTVHYEAGVALGEQRGAFTSVGVEGADAEGWIRTTERNLVIHPRDVTPGVIVNVATGVMRFDLLERVQVALSYGPYRQNLVLSPEAQAHRLVIRPEAELEDALLRTEGTLFYRDGAQVPLPPAEWSPQELVFINEPRGDILRVQLILADPNGDYERVRVRLFYEQGTRSVEEVFELTEHAQIEEWAVRLEDPAARGWRYEATLIRRDGAIETTAGTSDGSQLILGVKAVAVIPVSVTWLMVPPADDLLAVQIDLRYVDERNDLRWEHSELIQEEHSGRFTWSIPIKDRERRTYQIRVTEFRASGRTEGEWRDETDTALVLLPGG